MSSGLAKTDSKLWFHTQVRAHRFFNSLPLMVANITSYALATRLDPTPIYDALLLQDGIQLPHTQRHTLKQIPVSAAMTRTVVTVSAKLSVSEAFAHVQQLPTHYHAYPIVDEMSSLLGLFTFNDLKRALAEGKSNLRLGEIAKKELVSVHPDNTLDLAVLKLGRKGISQLPVVSKNRHSKLLGILTMHDIAKALAKGESLAETELDAVG